MGDPLSRGPVAWPAPDANDRPSPARMSLRTTAFSAMGIAFMAVWWNVWLGSGNPPRLTFGRIVLGTIGSGAAALLIGAVLRTVSICWPFGEIYVGIMAGQGLMRGDNFGSRFLFTVLMAVVIALGHWYFEDRAAAPLGPKKKAPWDDLA